MRLGVDGLSGMPRFEDGAAMAPSANAGPDVHVRMEFRVSHWVLSRGRAGPPPAAQGSGGMCFVKRGPPLRPPENVTVSHVR